MLENELKNLKEKVGKLEMAKYYQDNGIAIANSLKGLKKALLEFISIQIKYSEKLK